MYMSELKYTAYPDFGDMCIREVYFKGPTIYEVTWQLHELRPVTVTFPAWYVALTSQPQK